MACPDCFKGSVHEGEPRGEIVKLYGYDTYVIEPPGNRSIKGTIVMIPDAFGIAFVNNRLLADNYAEKSSFRVYLPDFMAGYSAPESMLNNTRMMGAPGATYWTKAYNLFQLVYRVIPWFYVNRIRASYPRIKKFFEALRQADPELPIGAVGFCWGGKHIVLLAGEHTKVEGKALIDAGFTGHPSLLSVPHDVDKMFLPVSFAIGDKETYLTVEQVEKIRQIVEHKPDGQKGEVKVYTNCSHGFCSRADTKFPDVKAQAAAAEDQCIQWFEKIFPTISTERPGGPL